VHRGVLGESWTDEESGLVLAEQSQLVRHEEANTSRMLGVDETFLLVGCNPSRSATEVDLTQLVCQLLK
jgi:hypothetical protein